MPEEILTQKPQFGQLIADSWATDAKNGQIWLVGMLHDDLGFAILQTLERLEREEYQDRVTLHINSRGGWLEWALAICNQMRTMSVPVDTRVYGTARSGACLIAVAGRQRSCLPCAEYLFHGMSPGARGHRAVPILADDVRRDEEVNQGICQLMGDLTAIPTDYWEAIVANRNQEWITSSMALQWGLVDRVEQWRT